ncbi:hypothetical protein [Paenibacillus daejeonensis]|uniref:hypothetical protein n=1 Tax=Paenibacillus daejeonensis TaxID=135193 RepID=UPI000369F7FD|nr:hypothetical protein [Paenibacillus daejeonensis]
MDEFDKAYELFLQQQKLGATGARRERLDKIGPGEKLLLRILWHVFQSFDGFHLEYEMQSVSGVKLYIDIYYEPLGIAFECDGYVVHAELITRERFTFERMRIRSMAMKGITYIPFSYDELEKKAEACQAYLYMLLGKFESTAKSPAFMNLKIQERELLRYMSRLDRKFNARDAAQCLNYSTKASRDILRTMTAKQLIHPAGLGTQRHHYYELTDRARELILAMR